MAKNNQDRHGWRLYRNIHTGKVRGFYAQEETALDGGKQWMMTDSRGDKWCQRDFDPNWQFAPPPAVGMSGAEKEARRREIEAEFEKAAANIQGPIQKGVMAIFHDSYHERLSIDEQLETTSRLWRIAQDGIHKLNAERKRKLAALEAGDAEA